MLFFQKKNPQNTFVHFSADFISRFDEFTEYICTGDFDKKFSSSNYSTEYNMRPEVVERKATWYQEKMSKMSIKERLELMVKRASHRAKLKEVNFDITWEDVEYVEICPILEIPLNWGETSNEGGRNIDTPSLDRINPELGYVKGNVKIISTLANMMKNSATNEQIQIFCKNIHNYLENEEIVRPTEKKESVEQEDKKPLG